MSAEPNPADLETIKALANLLGEHPRAEGSANCAGCQTEGYSLFTYYVHVAKAFLASGLDEVIAAREAAARREALLEAEVQYVALKVETLQLGYQVQRAKALAAQWRAEPYPSTADSGWNQGHDMRRESDAYALECALAEPERDEEGGR